MTDAQTQAPFVLFSISVNFFWKNFERPSFVNIYVHSVLQMRWKSHLFIDLCSSNHQLWSGETLLDRHIFRKAKTMQDGGEPHSVLAKCPKSRMHFYLILPLLLSRPLVRFGNVGRVVTFLLKIFLDLVTREERTGQRTGDVAIR